MYAYTFSIRFHKPWEGDPYISQLGSPTSIAAGTLLKFLFVQVAVMFLVE